MAVEYRHLDEGISLEINGSQAMQTWEKGLMEESAELLTAFGSRFLEVGLGFGFSALTIARKASTEHNLVIEKHAEVIQEFRRNNPIVPANLEILHGDVFLLLDTFAPESVDGVFFDPALPMKTWRDLEFWNAVMPRIASLIKTGGAFMPFFSTEPAIRSQYLPHFSKIVVLKRPFRAFAQTVYTHGTHGMAYIQCFVKER